MAASRSGGAATTSQASAFVFGAVVTAFAGGGAKTGSSDIESLLQSLLPGILALAARTQPGSIHSRDWATTWYVWLLKGQIWVLPVECGFIRFGCTNAQIRLDNPVVLRVVTDMGHNGLYDPLIDCWNTLDIGGDEGMEVMTLAGDTPGGFFPPWVPRLSSCLCIVMTKHSRVYAIVRCLLRAVHWNSLETALVNGSLLFVAPGCRLAELSDCEFVLRVSRVSADLLLCVLSSVSLTIPWRHCVAGWRRGAAGWQRGAAGPEVDRPGVDFQVQLQVSWNAPEVYATLDSDGIYGLKMTCVHDLGMRSRRP